MLEILGYILGFLGVILFVISGLGLLRMPDTLTRMQAATKASTLGSALVILGVACFMPEWTLKLVVLVIFIMITNPISSSLLARTTYNRYKDSIVNTSGADAIADIAKAKAAVEAEKARVEAEAKAEAEAAEKARLKAEKVAAKKAKLAAEAEAKAQAQKGEE